MLGCPARAAISLASRHGRRSASHACSVALTSSDGKSDILHWWFLVGAVGVASERLCSDEQGKGKPAQCRSKLAEHLTGHSQSQHQRKFEDFYRLIEKQSPLGSGSYGTVVAAAHRETGEVVAVKQIPRCNVSEEEVMAEVEILKIAGDHRHIIQLTDLFWDDKLWYVVMEMAKGGELFDRIVNKGLLTEHETSQIMKDLLHAIDFLHNHNIVHGDIKPENIMLAEDSSNIDVRLGDFGTAFEVMGRNMGKALSGSSRMTVAYSPPEVLDQDGTDGVVEVSPKADVWALGVLMYILIAGRHPFDMELGADESELHRRICEEEPDFSDPLWNEVSPAAIKLIKRLLTKDPTIRPTCAEALADLWFEDTAGHSHQTPAEAREAFAHFCEARRRIKACLLAVMVGIVDNTKRGSGREGGNVMSLVDSAAGPANDAEGDQPFSFRRNALTHLGFGPHAVGSRTVACRLIDRDGKGYIDAEDITAVMQAMGENLPRKEVDEMLKAVAGDPLNEENEEPKISYAQLSKLVPPLCPARVYKPGEVIYQEGEKDDTFYLIKKGSVEFSLQTPAGEKTLQGLTAGDSFGEVELVAVPGRVLPRVCTCRCKATSSERCELLAVMLDMFSLLTDVFSTVESRITAQVHLRLQQLGGEILRRGFASPQVMLNKDDRAWGPGCKGAGCIMSGCVVVVKEGSIAATWASNENQEVKRRVLGPGEHCFCGDLGLGIGEGKGAVTVDGLEDNTEVMVIPAAIFRDFLTKSNMEALRAHLV